jgi:peptide/nickel transport system substrate-binding protein
LNFFRGSWIADYPDAENYLSLFLTENAAPSGPNYTRFSDPAFDRSYRDAAATTDDSLRFAKYREMDRMVMQASPVIVLYYDQVIRLTGTDVHGLSPNAMNLLVLKEVWKSERTKVRSPLSVYLKVIYR